MSQNQLGGCFHPLPADSSLGQENISTLIFTSPWASFPFNQDLWALPQHVPNPDRTRIDLKPGEKAADPFDLPTDWPIQEGEKDLE